MMTTGGDYMGRNCDVCRPNHRSIRCRHSEQLPHLRVLKLKTDFIPKRIVPMKNKPCGYYV